MRITDPTRHAHNARKQYGLAGNRSPNTTGTKRYGMPSGLRNSERRSTVSESSPEHQQTNKRVGGRGAVTRPCIENESDKFLECRQYCDRAVCESKILSDVRLGESSLDCRLLARNCGEGIRRAISKMAHSQTDASRIPSELTQHILTEKQYRR